MPINAGLIIKISMLILFFIITIGVGFYFRKRNTSVDSYVLGGRSVGPWLTAFAYGTSYFSAVVFVGYAGQFGWRFGISAVWIGLGNAFIGSLLAWVVLARRTRVMTRHLNSATMPDFFGVRYSSNALKIGASIITFIFLVPYTASLYNGLSRLFAMAYNMDFAVCIAAMAILTAVYVIAGGYTATAVNDFIQGIIMLVGIVAVIMAVLNTHGGFIGSLDALARVDDAAVSNTPGIFASFFGPDPLNLLGVVLLTSVGTWGLPQMVQKFYAIRSEKNINTGTVISTIFAVIIAGGSYFLGSFGRLFSDSQGIAYNPNGSIVFDSIIPAMLSRFPDILIGTVIVLVFAASISTLSALVMTSASTFTLDFVKGNILKKMTERGQLLMIRILVAAFILIASLIALVQYNGSILFIAQLMGVSWGALAGAFLAPFLFGLYWKRTSKLAVWVNFIFASVFMLANVLNTTFNLNLGIFPPILRSSINAGAFTMIAGLIIVPLVSLITPKPDKKHVDNCFVCYEAATTVKARESLGISGNGENANKGNNVNANNGASQQRSKSKRRR